MNTLQTTSVSSDSVSWVRVKEASLVQSGFSCVSDWVTKINDHYDREKSGTIELAKMLYAAKCQLQKGEWTQLWKSGLIPFRQRKGQMLAVIGEKIGALDAQTSACLPSGWNILYQLARLDRPVLERLIADGAVHRALTLAEARALVAKFNRSEMKESSHRQLKQWLCKIRNFVSAKLDTWSPQEQKLVQSQFIELARQIALGLRRSGLAQKTDGSQTAEGAGKICPTAVVIVEANAALPPSDGQLIIKQEVINIPSAPMIALHKDL